MNDDLFMTDPMEFPPLAIKARDPWMPDVELRAGCSIVPKQSEVARAEKKAKRKRRQKARRRNR